MCLDMRVVPFPKGYSRNTWVENEMFIQLCTHLGWSEIVQAVGQWYTHEGIKKKSKMMISDFIFFSLKPRAMGERRGFGECRERRTMNLQLHLWG